MHDDNSILRNPELWLAALVSCGPAVIIATLMIMSLIQRQTPDRIARNRFREPDPSYR